MNEETLEDLLRAHDPISTKRILAPGRRIGDWEVITFLARGGHSEIYQGRHLSLQCTIALKFTTEEKSARLRHEAHVLSRLHHPAFPCVYGLAEIPEGVVLAEEFLEPYPLPHSDEDVAPFIIKLCEGLDYLHANGWVHRDIKPTNILRRPNETRPIIIDLGLAKQITKSHTMPLSELSVLPNGQAIGVGTPGYAAPEQFIHGNVTEATDIHALGVLIATCFNAQPPLGWTSIINRATSALPKLRFHTSASLARAIRLRNLLPILGITFLFLLINAALVWFLIPPEGPDPQEVEIQRLQEKINTMERAARDAQYRQEMRHPFY